MSAEVILLFKVQMNLTVPPVSDVVGVPVLPGVWGAYVSPICSDSELQFLLN